MADPYVPFGYMPPTLMRPGGQQPLLPFPLPSMQPMAEPTTPDALMPQTGAERLDLQQQGRGAVNMATMGAPFAMAGPAGWAGGQAMRLAAAYPELAAGIGAMLGTGAVVGSMEPTPAGAQRRGPPSDDIKALQRMLQKGGYYSGPIDGYMEEGTRNAKAAYDKAQAAAAAARQKENEAALATAKNENERRALELKQQEENRIRAEGERAQRLADEGAERARNIQPTFMEQYGTPLGYGFGLLMGGGGRYGLGRFMAREQRETATRANTLSGQMAAGQADDIPARVARVNQFWSEGAPGTPAPFSFQSARQPFPWGTNPNAVAPGQLYAPPTGFSGFMANYGPSAPGALLSAGEMGYGGVNLINAHRELQAAEDALSQPNGTTATNVQRVEAARRAVADANFMLRMGMGTLGGTVLGQLESNFTRSRLRPSALEADAERGRLDTLLNPNPPQPPPQPRIPKGQPGAGRFLSRR